MSKNLWYSMGGVGVIVVLFVLTIMPPRDCDEAALLVTEKVGSDNFTQVEGIGRCDGLCVDWSPIGCTISDDQDSWFVSLAGGVKKLSSQPVSNQVFTDSDLWLTLEYDDSEFTAYAGEASGYQAGSLLFDAFSSNSNPPDVRSSFVLNEQPYEGTNLFGAWVNLSYYQRLSDSDAGASCSRVRYGDGTKDLEEQVVINGTTWNYGTVQEAAAGTGFTTKAYHTVYKGKCVELAATIATGNIGNWESGAVQEVDESEVMTKLQELIATAKFE